MMNKKTLFRILNLSESREVVALGNRLSRNRKTEMLKKPEKILVMLQVRESAQNTLFYAGEALACECMVSIDGIRGFAASLGDDLDKVHAMAVIDAVMNAKLPESELVLVELNAWEKKIRDKHIREAGMTMSTKVNFNVMEE